MHCGEAVSCTVKPAVQLQIGNKTEASGSGVSVLDVSLPFGKAVNVQEITFKNFYTASVTVRLLRRSGRDAPAKWTTAVRHKTLMDDPHTEGGAQDYFSIHRDQMSSDADHVVTVRLILRQPSAAWTSFKLEELQVFPCVAADPDSDVSDWLSNLTLLDQQPSLEGLLDPQSVSSSIQQMWALTEVMQSNQTSASIGRFDVDGRYDLDLLSLS